MLFELITGYITPNDSMTMNDKERRTRKEQLVEHFKEILRNLSWRDWGKPRKPFISV